jgi:hypothetical protein
MASAIKRIEDSVTQYMKDLAAADFRELAVGASQSQTDQ